MPSEGIKKFNEDGGQQKPVAHPTWLDEINGFFN